MWWVVPTPLGGSWVNIYVDSLTLGSQRVKNRPRAGQMVICLNLGQGKDVEGCWSVPIRVPLTQSKNGLAHTRGCRRGMWNAILQKMNRSDETPKFIPKLPPPTWVLPTNSRHEGCSARVSFVVCVIFVGAIVFRFQPATPTPSTSQWQYRGRLPWQGTA